MFTLSDITHRRDWYKVTIKQVRMLGGQGLMKRYGGSFIHALQSIYPEYQWNPWTFASSHRSATRMSKSQHLLMHYVQKVTTKYEELMCIDIWSIGDNLFELCDF